KAGKHTVDIENTYIHISGATPYIRFEGTETGAADLSIRENSGKLEIYDEVGATTLMDILAHASRHAKGGADELTPSDISAVENSGGVPEMLADTEANRPAAGVTGRLFISTDTNKIYRDTGTEWVVIGGGAGTLSDLTIDADKDWLGYIIYNAGGFIVQPKSFNKGYTWKVPAGYVLTYVLPPGGELSGTDTIQGDGDFIGFEL
ncbi:MAG: hypothetical protein J7J91_03810, partial [Deltaproteobacteria bacterium]|nr:hypothetical protein [Deltaproteobacteria bacterium]